MDNDLLGDELKRGVETMPSVNMSNPYDFRRPVTESERLVGRDRELERIERCVDATCEGNPVHLALIGERAAGKTSLLNIAAVNAKDKGLLVVKVDLDEGVVATPTSFFRAVFEQAVGSLTEAEVLTGSDPRLSTWRRQVYQGQLDVNPSDELLLFGSIAAGQLHGAIPNDLSPFVLKHDFDRIDQLARQSELNGVLLLLDEGDLLGSKAEIFQKLRNVLQDNAHWMLIAAGTQAMFSTMSDVFSPIPRQIERITVRGLQDHFAVLRCMRRPLARNVTRAFIPFDVVEDVMSLTHGRPYEINLVSHFIWEEIIEPDAKQVEFKLTQSVLDNVVSELRGLSRDDEVREVDRIRSLDVHDFEDLAEVVPFQKMTIRQASLTKLLPWNYEAEELARGEEVLSRQIDSLVDLGVIRKEGDRFGLVGDEFVEVYLKYAMALHSREHGHPRGYGGLTYAQAVLDAFVRLALDSMDIPWDDNQTLRMRRSAEIGHDRPHSLGVRFCSDVESRDVPSLSQSTPLGLLMWKDQINTDGLTFSQPDIDSDHTAMGLSLQVGVELIEVLTLLDGTAVDARTLDRQMRRWAEASTFLLSKFDSRIEEITAIDVPSDLLVEIRNYSEAINLGYQSSMFAAFDAEEYSTAAAIVAQAVVAVQPYEEKLKAGRHYSSERFAYSDALNRQGFLTLLAGDPSTSIKLLERAMEIDDRDRSIRHFNLGRCQFELGDAISAEKNFKIAQQEWRNTDAFLLSVIDLPDPINTSSQALVSVNPEWGLPSAGLTQWWQGSGKAWLRLQTYKIWFTKSLNTQPFRQYF